MSALIRNRFNQWLFSFFFLLSSLCLSQDNDLIQFSGVVVEADSLRPVAFTKILIKNSNRGTLSDYYGYFSFVAQRKDTLVFSATGFRKSQYVIPDTLKGNKYSLIQLMRYDTIYLKETVIYPWPTKEQFKEVFLNMKVPDDDMARAKKNLDREEMMAEYNAMGMDAGMNFRNTMQNYQSRLYWTGQYPPNNLLNPIAWAQFIKMWREGKLKIKPPSEKKDKEEEDK
jgi:hypothetical protein